MERGKKAPNSSATGIFYLRIGTKIQRGPQHRLVCFAWGPSAAPTAMHPKEVNLDESRLRQATFRDHPLISKRTEGGQGLNCTTCIGLVPHPTHLKHQVIPGNAQPSQTPLADFIPTDP